MTGRNEFNFYGFHYRLVYCVLDDNFNRNCKIFTFGKGHEVKSCVPNFNMTQNTMNGRKGFNLYEFHYRLVHCVSTENFNRNGKIFSFNKGCKVKSCVQNFS